MGDKASMEFTNNQDKINCPGLITTPLTTQNIQGYQIQQTTREKTKNNIFCRIL